VLTHRKQRGCPNSYDDSPALRRAARSCRGVIAKVVRTHRKQRGCLNSHDDLPALRRAARCCRGVIAEVVLTHRKQRGCPNSHANLPALRRAARSCRNPLKGAKPVPGPTMMTGCCRLGGSLKWEWRMNTGTARKIKQMQSKCQLSYLMVAGYCGLWRQAAVGDDGRLLWAGGQLETGEAHEHRHFACVSSNKCRTRVIWTAHAGLLSRRAGKQLKMEFDKETRALCVYI